MIMEGGTDRFMLCMSFASYLRLMWVVCEGDISFLILWPPSLGSSFNPVHT